MASLAHDSLLDYGAPTLGALVVHLVAGGLVVVTVTLQPPMAPAASQEYIEAVVIDAQKIEEEALRLRMAEEEAARREADAAARRQAEAAAEVERQEAVRAAAEAERKAVAEREAAEQRARAEQAAAEQRERVAQKQRETDLKRQMDSEERRRKAERAGLMDQYKTAIQQKVMRSWLKPVTAQPGLRCEVRVEQIGKGEVTRVTVTECNGDETVVRSIENAVWRASPLPAPPDQALFERVLLIEFRPEK
jgi:colicin import membrane protein